MIAEPTKGLAGIGVEDGQRGKEALEEIEAFGAQVPSVPRSEKGVCNR